MKRHTSQQSQDLSLLRGCVMKPAVNQILVLELTDLSGSAHVHNNNGPPRVD